MYSWWQCSQPTDHTHQPPLQLGATILLMRLSRHWELLQRLLGLTDWTAPINGHPTVGTLNSTPLLEKWSSNSWRHSELWIIYSPYHLCPPHFHSFPLWISISSLFLLSGSPTMLQLTSTQPWKPVQTLPAFSMETCTFFHCCLWRTVPNSFRIFFFPHQATKPFKVQTESLILLLTALPTYQGSCNWNTEGIQHMSIK